MNKGPVLFDVEDPQNDEQPLVADAPPVPDVSGPDAPHGHAMQAAARVATRRTSLPGRLFWGLATALAGALVLVAFWDFVTRLLARAPIPGLAVSVLMAVFVLVCLAIVVREVAALNQLVRVDRVQREAEDALQSGTRADALKVIARLNRFYAGRDDTRWGRQRLHERQVDAFDADTLLQLAEDELLAPLDAAACAEVQAAARQVAAVTALVPLALADVVTVLASSVRMIRRVAEIYGGRSGVLGSWCLTRTVFAHLVVTGAIAAGDDLLETVLGSSVLSKLSRRFGEGVVNGALSARIGVAAMELCRPLPFSTRHKPSVRVIVSGALAGLFIRQKTR